MKRQLSIAALLLAVADAGRRTAGVRHHHSNERIWWAIVCCVFFGAFAACVLACRCAKRCVKGRQSSESKATTEITADPYYCQEHLP
mmetsp:Transcript_11458/g.34165  ORF Transcript_11458/g.34165 Transcript_11458/m.34165 type:complete len:87 (-) Transcript_11458:50-310(-)